MLPPTHPFFTAVTFVWGALWGSFLNVVIYRLPAGLSVVRPGSLFPMHLQPEYLVQSVVGAAVVGVLASIAPARRESGG